MEKSFAFNSINGDRIYKAEDFTEYFSSFIGNGVFPNPSTCLQVLDNNNNMSVIVQNGKGWINGYFYQNTDNYIINIDVADSVLDRIDRVVLCLDFQARSINLKVKKGTFASSPVAPNLQRDADKYELALADIKIIHGAIGINQADITDLRLENKLCGLVCSVVKDIDTTSIFNQYQAWLNICQDKERDWFSFFTDSSRKDFLNWFESIKGILGTDEAGNILNKLLELQNHYEKSSIDLENIQKNQLQLLIERDLNNQSTNMDYGYFFDSLKDTSKISAMNNVSLQNNILINQTNGEIEWKAHDIGFTTNKIIYYHTRKQSTIVFNKYDCKKGSIELELQAAEITIN